MNTISLEKKAQIVGTKFSNKQFDGWNKVDRRTERQTDKRTNSWIYMMVFKLLEIHLRHCNSTRKHAAFISSEYFNLFTFIIILFSIFFFLIPKEEPNKKIQIF